MLPIPHTPYPMAQKCRPQYFLRSNGYSSCNRREVHPFNRLSKTLMDWEGAYSICIGT